MPKKAEIMDGSAIQRAITRVAHQIIEKYKGVEKLAILGIQRRGVPLAKRIAQKILDVEGKAVPVGVLDITFYRDDLSLLSEHPVLKGSEVTFSVQDMRIVLVDDVLFTGRTVRAGIEAIMDMGRPKSIALAVLVDRGHRELPIKADFVGKNVPTALDEKIRVQLLEVDGEELVSIQTLEGD